MQNFPSLTVPPDTGGWSEEKAFDPTIRVRSEGGYLKTRSRTTRIPMQWKVVYEVMALSDKNLLQTFENTVRVGADAFNWTNPVDSQVRVVRLKEPVKYSPMGNPPSKLFWRAEMTLEEV